MVEEWVKEELKSVSLGDKRLDKRFMMLVNAIGRNPESSIPMACGTSAATKAAYRFFDNESVEAEDIHNAHFRSTVERVENSNTVLVRVKH